MDMRHAAVVAGLALGLMSGAAQASYLTTFTQTAEGVLAAGVGEFDTNLLTDVGGEGARAAIDPQAGIFSFGPSTTGYNFGEKYSGTFTGSPYGSGGITFPSTASGDLAAFNYDGQFIVTPSDYVSGTTLTSQLLFSGATFASLGLTPGTHTYSYSGQVVSDLSEVARVALVAPTITDTIIVQVGTVPLPASAPMFGASLMALGAVGYGLKRKGKAAA